MRRGAYHDGEGASGRLSPVVGRPEVLRHRPELTEAWPAADAAFPVRVTRSFWSRANLDDPNDPLLRQVLPDPAELLPDLDGLTDPVGDSACSPIPWVIHKYPRRILLLVTKRCHLYCRYCFRRTHQPGEREDPSPDEWEAALRYVELHRPAEVILSGGDPLAVRDDHLLATLERVGAVSPVLRLHTRAPITRPDRVTEDLVRGLAAFAQRKGLWVLVHCNHPRELSDEVSAALARLVDAGVPVLNQAVLLRGVNDRAEVQVELCEALTRRRVFPYYLHLTDRVKGNAHFRVGADEARALYAEMRRALSGLALPRLVVDPPDGSGKRDV